MNDNTKTDVGSIMDATTIKSQLPKATLPPEVDREELIQVNSMIAERALTRMAVNECGGLPSMPTPQRGLVRRFIEWRKKRSNRKHISLEWISPQPPLSK